MGAEANAIQSVYRVGVILLVAVRGGRKWRMSRKLIRFQIVQKVNNDKIPHGSKGITMKPVLGFGKVPSITEVSWHSTINQV
jgi:hypothetical protein